MTAASLKSNNGREEPHGRFDRTRYRTPRR
jgi:hypothetical protein